jgi:hypothetical protein
MMVFALADVFAEETAASSGGPVFPAPQNTLSITGVSFESMTNAIKIKWIVDTTGNVTAPWEIGIFSSTKGYPPILGLPDTVKLTTTVKDSCNLLLGDRLLFDTTYFFSCALRKRGGTWSAFAQRATGSVQTSAFFWQAVRYGVGIPTAYADNATIKISVDPMTFPTGVDTNKIVRWWPPVLPMGFIPVSVGFEFSSKYQSSPLSVAVKYGQLPMGHSPRDVKIYRYKNGLWVLDRSPFVCDSVQGYVSVSTGDLFNPFIAMIDIALPRVMIMSHPEKAVSNGTPIVDTFFVSDNISNVQWKFHFSKGGEAYSDIYSDSGMLESSAGTIVTIIPGRFVSADQGVRAMVSVSDEVNETIRDASRRVIRGIGGSDVVSTDTMKWVPLCVTAQLDSPFVAFALKDFAKNGQWKYDNTQFRLFRWVANHDSAHYVEYSDAIDSLFTFVPGRLFWIKTRKSVVLDFGKGITPDLTKPSTMTIPAGSWTDCALPYNFNIRIGDIIDATEASGEKTDGLRFCGWFRDPTRQYRAAEVYSPNLGVNELRDFSTIIKAKQDDGTGVGYSVFNQSDAAVNLSIPPLPAVLSKYKTSAIRKVANRAGRTIKIASRTSHGALLNDVYCVLENGNRGNRYLPAAPSLGGGVTVRVCDDRKRPFGHIITASGAASCDLAFANTSNRDEAILVTLSGQDALRTAFFNPDIGEVVDDSSNGKENWRIDVAPGTVSYCQLYAGDDAFLAKVKAENRVSKAALLGVSEHFSAHALRIRFSLPMGKASRATFTIFDMQGRKLWNSSQNGREGVGEIEWNGASTGKRPAACGTYMLQMTAFDAQGKAAAVFHKKWTWMH